MRRLSCATSVTILAICGCATLIVGCPLLPSTPENARLRPFASENELVTYFKSQATNQMFGGFGRVDLAFDNAVPEATAGDGGGARDFTTTNLQEVGVDEADVFKSDGTYFYIASDTTLRIVRAVPADDMQEVGRVELDRPAGEMYLRGDKLLLVSNAAFFYDAGFELLMWPPYYTGSQLAVTEIDVSDRTAPTVTRQIELDGSLVSSRLIGDRVILVLTLMPELPFGGTQQSITGMTEEQIVPRARTSDGEVAMVDWAHWYRPESPDGYFSTAVVTLDADNVETIVASTAVMGQAQTIYASQDALYLTDAQYNLSGEERETTAVHKFVYGQDGAAQYVASGSVPGRLLNQFSLGEHDGHLRLATHVFNFGGILGGGAVGVAVSSPPSTGSAGQAAQSLAPPVPTNAVYVLRQNGGALEVAGSIEDIAPDERIYSARFMGTRGFLVTFRQIDPLFVLDLSDPENPRVTGQLKIPGYSDYLHPLGDTHLIGVGRSAEETEWGGVVPKSLQLSLFDISDMSNPTLVQQIEVGGHGSMSEASYTHKAFAITEQNLLAIPAQLTATNTPRFEWSGYEFDGTLLYRVDPATGFAELGRVSAVIDQQQAWSWVPWRRPALIGDWMYAITPQGVRAAPIADPAATAVVRF